MQLKFYPRSGNYANWSRYLEVKDDSGKAIRTLAVRMETETAEQTVEREVKQKGLLGRMAAMFRKNHSAPKQTSRCRYAKAFGTHWQAGQLLVDEKPLWEGALPEGPPPGRAFCLASGLCDRDGNMDLTVPGWLK